MEIGKKLREARSEKGMTQEALAERLGVSRQTISSWENNRSYPDIVSLIALSDIYSLSLDGLLKGDKKMMEHLEESTNTVKSRQRLSKIILVTAYLMIWTMSVLVFWLGGRSDAMGYSILFFYLILLVSTLVISAFIGKDSGWENWRWVMLLFFGAMYMLADYATFSLANMMAFDKFNAVRIEDMLPGILCSAAGMAAGSTIRVIAGRIHRNV